MGRYVIFRTILAGAAGAITLSAQLIAPGPPIPVTGPPPVVFLNGYQNSCSGSKFSNTFGIADQVLQANGLTSLFFDNCSVNGSPSIEKLGAAFGDYLSKLTYADGRPVPVVDVVAHSMGGLIVRSYLSGKQEQEGVFSPPSVVRIRKAVFLATPHFGTGVAALGFGLNQQSDELSSGSHFLFGLATWNDGTDDLRGIDALAVIGNGGTGVATTSGFDDGVAALTSASLDFYQKGRTRILPYCHVSGGGLVSLGGFCNSNALGIAKIVSAADDNARIIVSFLTGTTEWQSIGQAPEQNQFLSTGTGIYVHAHTAADAPQKLRSATVKAANGAGKNLNTPNDEIGYTDLFPAGVTTVTANAASGAITRTATLPRGTVQPLTLKPGPNIARVLPAPAPVFPLSFAPRMIVSIYGEALATSTDQAKAIPLPLNLCGIQALWNGAAIGILYCSPNQVNAVIPDDGSSFGKLTIQNAAGSSTVNLVIEPVRPVIFTANGSGTGPAAAINARTGLPVSAGNPLLANDTLELFVTGLGHTTTQQGLNVAVQTPGVSIGGFACPVTFAGAAPGFVGLDQINCTVPSGLTANPAAVVLVGSGSRFSNAATVAVQ